MKKSVGTYHIHHFQWSILAEDRVTWQYSTHQATPYVKADPDLVKKLLGICHNKHHQQSILAEENATW